MHSEHNRAEDGLPQVKGAPVDDSLTELLGLLGVVGAALCACVRRWREQNALIRVH